MKKSIIMSLALIVCSTGAFAQSANGRAHGKGHYKQHHSVTTTTHTTTVNDKQVKRDVNRGGHMNNGDNGDKNNNRGRGDKNNH